MSVRVTWIPEHSALWRVTRELAIYEGLPQFALAVSAAVVGLTTTTTAPWLALFCVGVMAVQGVAGWLHHNDPIS